MSINGYSWVYMPEHHRAFSNGMVYEHVLAAEEMLGRELTDSEVVHHVDGNRSNNSPDNLMIFHSSSDHVRFHMTGRCERLNDGTFISVGPVSGDPHYDICPECGGLKRTCAKICLSCLKNKKPDKDALYELLKTHNKSEIGRMYGVSESAVRKWIRSYQL